MTRSTRTKERSYSTGIFRQHIAGAEDCIINPPQPPYKEEPELPLVKGAGGISGFLSKTVNAVEHGQHHRFHAVILDERFVEIMNRVVARILRGQNPPAP